MKRCSTLLISEIQIKTSVSSYLTHVRMVIIKKTRNVGEDVEERDACLSVSNNVKWCNHYGEC